MIIDKHKYSWYGIGFNRKQKFSVGNRFGRNCIIFGVDIISSVHVNNKKKYILIFGEGPTTLTAEKEFFENFFVNNIKMTQLNGSVNEKE